MRSRTRNPFTTVKTAGLLLPIDLLARIADGDPGLPGLKPEAYHLDAGDRLNEAAARAWNECSAAWKRFRQEQQKLPTSDVGTTLTRERWLLPLFKELGYGRLQPQKAIPIEDKTYPISHSWGGHIPIHLVSFRLELDKRTPGAAGAASRSPYSLVQELLNRSAQHRWGFLSNGRMLYVLRDNVSLTRAANVEFDLEAMFDGDVFADFKLLFLLCHESRVEIPSDGKPEDCWLEKWSKLADDQGTRAREKLRDGVERAIKALGAGFLTTRGSTALRDRLRSGELATQDYYRQLLRMVYRLLLLLVAEEKKDENGQNLLHPPGTTDQLRRRYAQYYSVGRLRTLASKRRGTTHTDLYESLKLLFQKLRIGYPPLGIPGLGSFLFSPTATPDLDSTPLSNEGLLDAIRALCITEDTSGRGGSVPRPVDFANLGSDELGSVYESLLELHPKIDTDEGPFSLATAAGHERKTTGSYYTPTSLIHCLLDSALDPVAREALNKPTPAEAEKALLNLRVCDPACGSGHFLIAAAERLAKHLASLRTGDDEPSTLAIQHAKREIIGRCIYGVDINPMSVELCQVALWMEALEPGKPFSFLEHHILCGNSLIGATPALLARGIPDDAFKPIESDDKKLCTTFKKQNKQERQGYGNLFEERYPWERLGNLAAAIAELDALPDETADNVRAKEERYRKLVEEGNYRTSGKFLADLWCAAFAWRKDKTFDYPITERIFRCVEANPHDVAPWMYGEIRRLAEQYQFFHWHLAFPGVFRPPAKNEDAKNELTGWNGGFDCMIGNPPWEMPEVDDRVFFSDRAAEITNEKSAQKRKAVIASLAETSPGLLQQWRDHLRLHECERFFFSSSGAYPNGGSGRLNYYKLFLEGAWHSTSQTGRLGMVIPSGLTTNAYERPLWHSLVKSRHVSTVLDFENKHALFPSVHKSAKFSIFVVSKKAEVAFLTGCWLHSIGEIRNAERVMKLTLEDLTQFSPEELALPQFRTKRDLKLLRRALEQHGILSGHKDWEYTPRLMFSSSDAAFQPVDQATLESSKQTSLNRRITQSGVTLVPVYEGKMVGILDHRQADIYLNPNNPARAAQERPIRNREKTNPIRFAVPQFWLHEDAVRQRRFSKVQKDWELVFCDVTSATNERTALACVIPLSGLTRNLPAIYLATASAKDAALLAAVLSTFVLDFFARLKVSSNHLTQGILATLPIPSREVIRQFARKSFGDSEWFEKRALELCYTAWDLEPFAHACGYDGPPFAWDDSRRAAIQAELDAACFHLYGLARDEVEYVMDSFSSIARREIDELG